MIAAIISFGVGVLSSIVATAIILARRRIKYRLRFQNIVKLIEGLARTIRDDGYSIDHVVAIGRNSGVVGSILAGSLGLQAIVSVSVLKSRAPSGARVTRLDTPSEAVLQSLGNTRVLLLICCNDSGSTLEFVSSNLANQHRAPTEIRTAALYSSPSPAYMPKYCAVTLERDSRQSMNKILNGLPWVTRSWIHPFGSERFSNNETQTW